MQSRVCCLGNNQKKVFAAQNSFGQKGNSFFKRTYQKKIFFDGGDCMRLLILPLKLAVKIFHAHYMDADLTADFVGEIKARLQQIGATSVFLN